MAEREELRRRARELVLKLDAGALALARRGAHAREAERVERARVREQRVVVVRGVRRGAHHRALRDARPVGERDVLHRDPAHRH